MPRIRRKNLPPALLQHLLDRIQQREISAAEWGLLASRLDENPEVPVGKWFKRFPDTIVCGEGDLIRTFLTTKQVPVGEEIS
jgi:hypothetical protein